jgi:hypothetical protein
LIVQNFIHSGSHSVRFSKTIVSHLVARVRRNLIEGRKLHFVRISLRTKSQVRSELGKAKIVPPVRLQDPGRERCYKFQSIQRRARLAHWPGLGRTFFKVWGPTVWALHEIFVGGRRTQNPLSRYPRVHQPSCRRWPETKMAQIATITIICSSQRLLGRPSEECG